MNAETSETLKERDKNKRTGSKSTKSASIYQEWHKVSLFSALHGHVRRREVTLLSNNAKILCHLCNPSVYMDHFTVYAKSNSYAKSSHVIV